jgi:hypothetical protein
MQMAVDAGGRSRFFLRRLLAARTSSGVTLVCGTMQFRQLCTACSEKGTRFFLGAADLNKFQNIASDPESHTQNRMFYKTKNQQKLMINDDNLFLLKTNRRPCVPVVVAAADRELCRPAREYRSLGQAACGLFLSPRPDS